MYKLLLILLILFPGTAFTHSNDFAFKLFVPETGRPLIYHNLKYKKTKSGSDKCNVYIVIYTDNNDKHIISNDCTSVTWGVYADPERELKWYKKWTELQLKIIKDIEEL